MDFSGVPYTINSDIIGFNDQLFSADAALGASSLLQAEHGELAPHEYIEPDSGDFQPVADILIDGGDRFGVSSIHLDRTEELIWSANSGGHVSSYYSVTNTSKYTSFQVHNTEEIRDLCSINEGILCLSPTSLNLRTRYGIPAYTYSSEKFENMQTLCHVKDTSRVLIGGHQSTIVEFDLETQTETNTYTAGTKDQPGDCVILRDHPRFIIHGERNGSIALHDPRSMREEHRFKPHHAALSDFDVQGTYIASCGYTSRMGTEVQESLLMVYDMRLMKMGLPVRCAVPPYLLRFVPNFSSVVAIITSSGLWNTVDIMQPETALLLIHNNPKQNNMMADAIITSMAMSQTSQVVAFGDNCGQMHLWGQGSKPVLNQFSQESPYPAALDDTPSIPITDQYTPLGSIPLAIPDKPLLSDWPTHLMAVRYRPTPAIDPQMLAKMNMQGPVGYHPNTLGHSRNVVPYQIFKGRKKDNADGKSNDSTIMFKVPRRYRRMEIKYSKLGIDDFDFDFYNRTSFVGLDMSLPNSYCNSMIQMFYYLTPMKATLISHLCSREFCLTCELGFLFHMLDISMNQGMPCNAANFLRAFRTIPEASAMGLTIPDAESRAKVNLDTKIMSWNLFVLQQVKADLANHMKEKAEASGEAENFVPSPNFMDQLFGFDTIQNTRCTRCSHTDLKESTSLLQVMTMNEVLGELYGPSGEPTPVTFSKVLEACMCKASPTQAWCEKCKKYQPQQQIRTYKSLPNTLVVNTGLDNSQSLYFWQDQHRLLSAATAAETANTAPKKDDETTSTPSPSSGTNNNNAPISVPPSGSKPCRYKSACVRPDCKFWHPGRMNNAANNNHGDMSFLEMSMECSWLPLAIRALLNEDGTVSLSDVPEDQVPNAEDNEEGVVYDLVGVVSHISDPKFPDKNNLIATIKVGKQYHAKAGVSAVEHWYLFNDISISPISAQEAVWFPVWKQPCVLFWTRRNVPAELTACEPVNPINKCVLLPEIHPSSSNKTITFMPLTKDEIPAEGDLVAMDAEFVNLRPEEAEIRSDGTRSTVKPSHKSVARITCIRGQGPLKAMPFMDDYINTPEQVVDYLTKFSGINPGDLDANYSQKHLTDLKTTYVKLRYLVDQGVKFVGHGLKNDFRVINMVVPPQQLIDTLHLFHMPHNRMLSLRFLAWHFLHLKIQSETHDSVEDASAALLLYEKYLELQRAGNFREELEAVYEAGKKTGWKVPGEDEGE